MDKSIFGFVFFVAAFLVGRYLNERALKKLKTNEQEKLLKGFSRYRIFSFVGLISLVILHYVFRLTMPDTQFSSMQVFAGVLVFYLLFSNIYAFVKLKKLKMPDPFINQYLISTFIQYVGLFTFFGLMIGNSQK